MKQFAETIAGLSAAGVRFVVMGVWGANYYAAGSLFVTQDQDLFLPTDPANLLRAWAACEQMGLELVTGGEELDRPRDARLADAVVRTRALTTATDRDLLQVDLSLVMAGCEFEAVWRGHREFLDEGVITPVASLADIVASKRIADRPKDRLFLATHAAELRRLLGGSSGTP